jgi:hypothetical protein
VIGEPALERRLPRRRLADAPRHDVAHDALVDGGGIDARPLDGFANHHGAQLGSGEVLQRAEEFSGGEAYSTDDECVSHIDGSILSLAGGTEVPPLRIRAQLRSIRVTADSPR